MGVEKSNKPSFSRHVLHALRTSDLKSFDLDLRIENITADQAEILLSTIKTIIEGWDGTTAGGIVEVGNGEES